MPADDRDPKPLRSVVDDPRPGDVARKDGERREIITLGSAEDIEEWRKWAATAEVITMAGEDK